MSLNSSNSSTSTMSIVPVLATPMNDSIQLGRKSNKSSDSPNPYGSTGGSGSSPASGAFSNYSIQPDALPSMVQLPLDAVLIRSTISQLPAREQARAILDEFNKGLGDRRAITTTMLSCRFGERIERGQFMLAHRNGVPELHPYHEKKLTTCFSFYLPNTVIEKIGVYEQNDQFYGAHGSYVINVPQGKYAQVWFGQTAKLLGPGAHVIQDVTFRLAMKAGTTDISSAFVDISTPHILHHTINIIRVPVGKVAKAVIGTTPYLLYSRSVDEPYIVNDPLFRLDGIVSQLDPVLSHGITHILRVPSGHLCKAWIGSQPIILESRMEPYVFHDPLFRLDNAKIPFAMISEPYIRHMNLHRLRIPAGKIAKVWFENRPEILQSQESMYVFDSAFFRLSPADPTAISDDGRVLTTDPSRLFEDAFKPYISHGVIHVLRVPSGKIARVWDGAKAMLLEYRAEPYTYNSALFRLEPASNQSVLRRVVNSLGLAEEAKYSEDRNIEDANTAAAGTELFEDATSPCIVHGSVKRLQPRTGEVCLTYENGQLVIREPPKNGKPIYIDDENCRVDGFISVGVQTLVFPSDETKALRKRENAAITTEEMNYEIFTTKDSLRVGVKLLVAFKIVDARKAIMELTRNGIVKHVENCCVVDMGKSIQACSSRDFLNSAHNKPSAAVIPGGEPSLLQHFQDQVKVALAADLHEFGIELVRLNFETPKILDKDIAKQMAEQALSVAAVSSQEAVMKQQADIARVRADQAATVQRIAQEQANANKLSIARTAKEAAQLEADAIIIAAEANHRVHSMQGRQFDEHSSLLQIKLAEIHAQAMSQAKISMVIAPEKVGNALSMFGNMHQFMGMAAQLKQLDAQIVPQRDGFDQDRQQDLPGSVNN